MNSKFAVLILASLMLVVSYQNFSPGELGISTCPGGKVQGPIIISKDTRIVNRDCIVNGDLTVTQGAVLSVNLSGESDHKFVVRGNIRIEADSRLYVSGRAQGHDVFAIANEFSGHRTMTTSGTSRVYFNNIEFRTQEDLNPAKGSVYTSFFANDRSLMSVTNSKLNTASAWLLGYFNDNSLLVVSESQGFPTEVYIHDSSSIRIQGRTTQTGVWMDAENAKGKLVLPDVSAPYHWRVGRQSGLNVGWQLNIVDAQPGLAVEVKQGTELEIIGRGAKAPPTGELKIGYYVERATEDLVGLNVGIQNRRISQRLILRDVQLGPIAWQIYPGHNAVVNIRNSKINEIGISGSHARVSVEGSILQLGVIGAMAPSSRLSIKNSQIWNQSIEADGDAEIFIEGSHIFGSLLHARSANSKIAIRNSMFQGNPARCAPSTMIDIKSGQPKCNPYRSAGQPMRFGEGQVTCVNTGRCDW